MSFPQAGPDTLALPDHPPSLDPSALSQPAYWQPLPSDPCHSYLPADSPSSFYWRPRTPSIASSLDSAASSALSYPSSLPSSASHGPALGPPGAGAGAGAGGPGAGAGGVGLRPNADGSGFLVDLPGGMGTVAAGWGELLGLLARPEATSMLPELHPVRVLAGQVAAGQAEGLHLSQGAFAHAKGRQSRSPGFGQQQVYGDFGQPGHEGGYALPNQCPPPNASLPALPGHGQHQMYDPSSGPQRPQMARRRSSNAQWSARQDVGESSDFLTPLQAAFLPDPPGTGASTPDYIPSPSSATVPTMDGLHLSALPMHPIQPPDITPRATELGQQGVAYHSQLPPSAFQRRESSSSLHREMLRESHRPYPAAGARHAPHSSQSSFESASSGAPSFEHVGAMGGGARVPKPLNGRTEVFGWARATGHLVRVTGPVRETDDVVVFPPGSYNKLLKDEMEILPSDSKAAFDAWIRIQDCPAPCQFKFSGKRPATIRAHLVTCAKRAHLNPDALSKLCQLFRAGRKDYEDEMTRLSELAKGEGRMVLPARWAGAGLDPQWQRRDSEASLAGHFSAYTLDAQPGADTAHGYSPHTEAALQAFTGLSETHAFSGETLSVPAGQDEHQGAWLAQFGLAHPVGMDDGPLSAHAAASTPSPGQCLGPATVYSAGSGSSRPPSAHSGSGMGRALSPLPEGENEASSKRMSFLSMEE